MNGGPIPASSTPPIQSTAADKDKVPDDGWTALGNNEQLSSQKLSVFAICLS